MHGSSLTTITANRTFHLFPFHASTTGFYSTTADVIKKVKQGQRGNAADAAVIPPTPVEQETDFEIAGELVGGAYRTTKNIKNGKKYNTGQFAMKNDAFEGRPIVSNDNLSFDHGKDPKETGTGHLSK